MEHSTYCNPLPLPDYPRGRESRRKHEPNSSGWLNNGARRDFREMADPSVLFHDGAWYLYPSGGMAWVSDDFVTWRHEVMNVSDIGYAPTIMALRGRFYMTASEGAPLYVADAPLGPWRVVGPIRRADGKPLPYIHDPMYFADDDGRVFLYWGCGGPGIFGAEVDAGNPDLVIEEPRWLFGYNPDHVWERFGAHNEDPSQSYVEGSWMLKHAGRYYLTYAAPGTEFASYGMGVYVADAPLGPFRYQARNPILSDTSGLVRGPGHGCLVRGPNDTLWAFYTCTRCYHHVFERRVGCDPAGFDEDGNLFVRGASDIPQWAPGRQPHPEQGNDAGLLPTTVGKPCCASSEAPGRVCTYPVDGILRTWWEAATDDREPWLSVELRSRFAVSSARIVWAEPNLDYDRAPPGPFRYRIEGRNGATGAWEALVDRTGNTTDLLIDYLCFPVQDVTQVRLTVTGAPMGVGVGVEDFTVFGAGYFSLREGG